MTTRPADKGTRSSHYLNVLQENPKVSLGLQFPASYLKWEPSVRGQVTASLPLCGYSAVKAAPTDVANQGSRVSA